MISSSCFTGLENNRPNLLLGLAIIQKLKRPGNLPQEIEEKRPKVHMSKDPMWIPKPPVLYGSDKLEVFQPYDPETPASTTPPGSPSCPGSPSDSSSSGSVTIPVLTSVRVTPPISTSATAHVTQSSSNIISGKGTTNITSSEKTPLQTILKTLFGNKQTDSVVLSEGNSSSTTRNAVKLSVSSQVSGSMMDPIVQQYGHKSKVKKIEEEENEFDRPYDPEEEYDPAAGYGMVPPQSRKIIKTDGPAPSTPGKDDVAYDPEDETIFEDFQSDVGATKPPAPALKPDSVPCPIQNSTQVVTPLATSNPAQPATPATVLQNLPTGTVVVSAATLTEQQRMLEELNKQIEEQKRQLKEQEEALRQQREAVGMFMAHFSVSDSLMSPPTKSLPLNQLSSLQSGIMQTESRPLESTSKTTNLTEALDSPAVSSETVKTEDANSEIKNNTESVAEQDETLENMKESDKYSSAGEIEDSDVAYDPEDESLFNEIQDDVFPEGSMRSRDSSLSGTAHNRKGSSPNSYHSRKQRQSPKRRSHRERDHHRSPSRQSQRRSPSHSRRRKERDRCRRSESDRSRHRTRDPSEHQGRHRKGHTSRRHSHGRRRSPSSPRGKDSISFSSRKQMGSSQVLDKSKHPDVQSKTPLDPVTGLVLESNTSSSICVGIKNDPDDPQLKSKIESAIPQQNSADKDVSPSSYELLHNVKVEKTEPPESLELEKHSLSDKCSTGSGPEQIDKTSQEEIMLKSKFEHTVPLREIDPPIRDSPQSPDPEPQFLKPSSVEENDSSEGGIVRDPVRDTSDPVPQDLQGQDFKGQCMVEAGKQIEGSAHNHPLGQGGSLRGQGIEATLSSPWANVILSRMQNHISDLKTSESEMRNQCMSGQGNNLQDLTIESPGQGFIGPGHDTLYPRVIGPGPHMKQLGSWGPHIDMREAGLRFPGPNVRDQALQGIKLNILSPGPHIGDFAMRAQQPVVRGPGAVMQGSGLNMRASGIEHQNSDKIDSGTVTRDSGASCSVPDMEHSKTQGVHAEQDIMNEGRDSSLRGPQTDGVAPNPDQSNMVDCGPGKTEKSQHSGKHVIHRPDSRHIRDRSPHIRSLSRAAKSSETDGRESKYDSAAGSSERDPLKGVFRDLPHGDKQDTYMQGPWHDIKNEQMDQQCKSPVPDMRNSIWRGLGPDIDGLDMSCDMSGQRSQRNSGPQMMDDWRGPNRRRSGPVRRGSYIHDKWRGHQPDRRDSDMEGKGPDRRGAGGVDFIDSGPELSGPNMHGFTSERRGFGGPITIGSGSEGRGEEGWVGPGGPDFREPGPERTGVAMSRGPDRVGQGCPDFKEPEIERRIPNMEDPGYDQIGPRGLNFRGPGPEMRGPNVEGLEHNKREPGGSDFRGPGPEWRDPAMDFPGPEWRDPAMQGPGPEWSDPAMQGPRPEWRDPAIQGPGCSRRGAGGLDFKGQGPERNPSIDHPGSDRRRQRGPDFRGPVSQKEGPVMEGPGLDRSGSECPDLRVTEPGRGGPGIEGQRPDGRGWGGQDLMGPVPERIGTGMEALGPDRRVGPHFRGTGPERRYSDVDGTEPDRRYLRGPSFRGHGMEPNLRGPGLERQGPNIEDPRLDRRAPGDARLRDPGPERRLPDMEAPGLNRRGPDFRRTVSEGRGPDVERPGHGRRGPGFRGPGPERPPDMEGPGPQRGLPGGPHLPDLRPERICPDVGSGSDRRGPHLMGLIPDRKTQDMEGPGPLRKSLGISDFREPVPETQGPHIEGPQHDRRGPHSLGFRGPSSERRGSDVEGPGPEYRQACPDFGDPDKRKGQNTADFRESHIDEWGGPNQERVDMEVPESDRKRPGLSGTRPIRRGSVMRRPVMGGRSRGAGCRGPGFRNSEPDRRDIDTGNQGPERREPIMEAVLHGRGGSEDEWKGHGYMDTGSTQEDPDMEYLGHGRESYGNEWREPGCRGPRPMKEGTDMPFSVPDRRGHRDEWSWPEIRGPGPMQDCPDISFKGPGSQRPGDGEWRDPDCGGAGPNRRGPSPHFRRERDPGMRGPGCDRRGPYMTASRSDRREGPDTGNDWRQVDFMALGLNRRSPSMDRTGADERDRDMGDDRRGPDMEGPGHDRGHPDFRNSFPNRRGLDMEVPGRRGSGPDFRGPGPENRLPDIEDPGTVRRKSDCRGPGSERRGLYIENTEPSRHGHEQDFRRERRGLHMRRLGSDEKDSQLQDHWTGPDKRESEPERQFSDRGRRPVKCGPNTEGPWFDGSGPEMRERGLDRRGPEPAMNEDIQGSFIRGPKYHSREPNMRSMEPGLKGQITSNERRGPELRHLDMPASIHFNNPSHQVTRFQGSSGQQPPLFNRPLGSAPESGEPSCPRLDNPQNQQMVRPQRHRGALLPTPTQGLIRFPHRTINVNLSALKQKQARHTTDSRVREWNRGTSVGVSKGGSEKEAKETEKVDSDGNKQSSVDSREIRAKNDNEATTPDSKVST